MDDPDLDPRSVRTSATRAQAMESLVCFSIGPRAYALDVLHVSEVHALGSVYPMPAVPTAIIGAVSVRGTTLPLVDAPLLLGVTADSQRSHALVIVRDHEMLCALAIDRVLGVVRLESSPLVEAPDPDESGFVLGKIPGERETRVGVLDSARVLAAVDDLRFR